MSVLDNNTSGQNRACVELSMRNQMADRSIEEIHRFLVDHNFESTAKTLVREASEMGFQNFEYKSKDFANPYDQLIICYNAGNYLTFFQLWNDLFSDSTKQCKTYKKLTFYLHVYFAILPICKSYANEYKDHELIESEISMPRLSSTDLIFENYMKNNGSEVEKNVNNSMKQLQDYLSGDGKELEYDTELQPFYKLPFTEDLHGNTLFSKVLKPHWLDELSQNLQLFITDYRQDFQSHNLSHMTASARKTKEAESARNKAAKDNIPIMANDRDIPIFLDDNDEEQYSFGHEINLGLKLNGGQTHVTGDQIAFDNSRESKSELGENLDSLPRMYKQDRKMIQYNQELALTKSHLYSIYTNYEKLKLRFHKLHVDYNKLINIARELTIALENSLVKGQDIDIPQTLEICMNICPDLFNQNIRDISYTSLLQRGHSDRLYNTDKPPSKLDIATASTIPSKLLDFKKIKLHLLNGDVKTKLLLLQALRWRVTLAQPTERDKILHEYMSHDLLGLHGQIANDNSKSLLPCLLTAGEAYARHLLQQFIARLLNTLASFRYGRDYLSAGSTVVNVTFICFDNNYVDGMDPFACDMLVAMLQKLSLRTQQRIYMIESGLLEWLINHLYDNCRVMSLYRLEYATALLMNLSLHRLARARAAKISSLLMSTLLVLLSMGHASSLQYVNETLNNFLRNPVINEEARKMKRSNMSDYIGGNLKTAEIRKHLDHILKIQRRENVTPQNDETADDDNEEQDILESEVDENDPLRNYVGELNGETLLEMCYSISTKIPEDAVTIDTALQKIATLNPTDFYNDQQNNYLCADRPSYPTLRQDETERNILPKEGLNKRAALSIKRVSQLSNFSPMGQKIANGMNNKSLTTDKVQSVVKDFTDATPSFIIKDENQECGRENGNLPFLKNTVWPLNLIDKKNIDQYQFENQLQLSESEAKSDMEKSCGDKFREMYSENVSSKAVQAFATDISRRITPDDTIYLYENQSSKNSSETAVTSSMILASGRENCEITAEAEKFSSIASLNTNDYDSNVVNDSSWKNGVELAKEEEAFLAKPKISRTPP